MAGPAIRTAALSKRFGDLLAVDRLDLEVARGEMFGLVGPDGAGKTTTIRMIAGILAISGGQTEVAGFDVAKEPDEVKRRIGYMSQAFSLYGDLSVSENIDFFANLFGVPRRERASRKEELLAATNLAPFRRRLADRLSGGMKQKLGLACTLIHVPEVLLLDEPTTGVDPVSRREFWNVLRGLLDRGVTILLSTPYMDEAERCSRVGLIHEGRLAACARPADLKRSISGEIVAVRCADRASTLAALAAVRSAGAEVGVLSAQLLGDRIRVLVRSAAEATPQLEGALRSRGIALAEIAAAEPTLEDVFISTIGPRKEEHAAS